MDNQQVDTLVRNLYQAVDNKDVDYLNTALSEHSRFRLGNYPEVTNKAKILEGNSQFFSSIESMKHTIDDIMFQGSVKTDSTRISCFGTVDYVRLDGSEYSAVFSTFLDVKNGLIEDYLVFADISGL
ncbi:nuclear transport factor 2 family protein [Enterovibrio makurazakiensis]|uniref:Nuclear transport factor 2 family protein n=1 Tax=Enterovibrio gelatinilyticus TaxID=2899819 RepID=A0ABT5QYC5_9GAMM|nr:nuclear transport factor 2 family protein [Enterovibrio sp. ZSDZ42]MDD1793024.1 nuclear transport factor 2 family protein [Enterovibrio sp. ZSDZ42]